MNHGDAFDVKEQVRQAIDIVDLVGSYIELRRQGRNFVGRCPWHDDNRPSLQVNPDRQSFKCWVCDLGGDVFSFAMKMEGLEFREALEMLAERAGVSLHRSAGQGGPSVGASGGPNDKRTLYRLMAWAEEQYHQCLVAAADGEAGRRYLAERGITPESIQRFRLGFAPDQWDWLLLRARQNGWAPDVLERVGLLRRKELGGGHYDWFRGRVMFSIRDARARPVAFGGRVLPQLAGEHAAKYINSPETPLFSKSRELYGLDLARETFRSAGGAIVMEGYTDCVMAHQHGITNCVAVLGTALGERHLQVLRRWTDSITLTLDGDEAGRRRTDQILDHLLALFEKNQVDLRILTLPEGVDPCDFIAQQGSDSFRHLADQAVDALEHKFRAVTQGSDMLTDTHRASRAAEEMLALLAQIRPGGQGATSQSLLREEQMLSRIARRFHLSEERLRSRLSGLRRDARRRPSARPSPGGGTVCDGDGGEAVKSRVSDLPACDRLLLELLLSHSRLFDRIRSTIEPAWIESDVARSVYQAWLDLVSRGEEPEVPRLIGAFDDAETKSLLVGLDEICAEKPAIEAEQMLQDVLAAYERRSADHHRRLALAAARHNPDEAERLLESLYQQSKQKHLTDYERRKR